MLAAIDDAWQEVFVECLKPGGVLVRANRSAPEGFRALLGAVVRNVALRAETARHRAQPLASDVSATVLLAPVSSVGRTLDRSYAQELLRAAAAEQARRAETVGDGARRRVELLRMHFEEGRTIPEIAAVWERDASYVHHQYAKARADFERALRAVLVARFPELADGDLRARCLELVQLLRSG
jgi:hypothetical protein